MIEEKQSFEILERALDAAGADEADAVFLSGDRNISRFANSNLHQNMSEESGELTMRVISGAAMGVASTTLFDRDEIARTAALAREAARHARPMPNFSGLYRGGEPASAVRTYSEAAHQTPAKKAAALRTMFDHGAGRGIQFAGSYTTAELAVACANSHGVRRFCRITSSDATVIGLRDGGSGYATQCSRAALDVAALGSRAIDKATLRDDNTEDFAGGDLDVILEPPAIAEVLDWMNLITFSGQAFEDGSSFFVGNIGKRVLSERFTLVDDSLDESFLPFPFDLEGLPRRRVTLIEHGVPRTPVVDKTYADRLSIPPTANAWHLGAPEHGTAFHMAVAPGNATRDELIASTKRGLWVTRFNYVNGLLEPKSALMTGTTRDGTFLIRDGKVAARLPNLRWTQSMVEAFSNIEGLSRDRECVSTWYNPFGGTLAPTMKIRGWHFDATSS
ncbi:MAG TPA: metallopeptidase TldD-related protein [Thermoanaerobaculia bacterium]|nr:metallopeptidase TldD-related protein [Thermoanaerobaculia bacterium]